MEGFDLPSLCIPVELLDSVKARAHGQICQQLPIDLLPTLGLAPFPCMNHGKHQFRISLFLVPRWTNHDTPEPHLQHNGSGIAAIIAHLDRMKATDFCSVHLSSDRGVAVCGQPVHAGAHKEMRSQFSRKAGQLEDVSLSLSLRYGHNGQDRRAVRWNAINSPAGVCSPFVQSARAWD